MISWCSAATIRLKGVFEQTESKRKYRRPGPVELQPVVCPAQSARSTRSQHGRRSCMAQRSGARPTNPPSLFCLRAGPTGQPGYRTTAMGGNWPHVRGRQSRNGTWTTLQTANPAPRQCGSDTLCGRCAGRVDSGNVQQRSNACRLTSPTQPMTHAAPRPTLCLPG